MKILVVAHEFPPQGGGAGIVAKQFISGLIGSCEIDVITRKSIVTDEIEGVNIHQVPLIRGLWFFCYLWYLIKNIKLNKYDYIVANDAISLYLCGSFLTKKMLKRTICLLHGSEPEYAYLDNRIIKKLMLTKFVFNRLFLNCKVIFSHSNYMKEKIATCKSFSDLNVAHKIEVSYFGYNENLFYQSEGESEFNIKIKHGIENNKKVLVSASRIVAKKGYKRKLELFKRVLAMGCDYHWLIIGDGAYKEEFARLIEENGLEKNISIIPKVEQNVLRYYYSQADLFWLLSEYKESFGLVYIESQACGTPAIGPNQFGVKESIDNLNTGLLSNSDEEIVKFIRFSKYKEFRTEELIRFSANFKAVNFSKRLEMELTQ